MINRVIGALLYDIRNEHKLSQEEMANALGVSQSTIGRIENGRTRMNVEHLLALRESLGMDINKFFDRIRSKTREMIAESKKNQKDLEKFLKDFS